MHDALCAVWGETVPPQRLHGNIIWMTLTSNSCRTPVHLQTWELLHFTFRLLISRRQCASGKTCGEGKPNKCKHQQKKPVSSIDTIAVTMATAKSQVLLLHLGNCRTSQKAIHAAENIAWLSLPLRNDVANNSACQ